MILNWRKLLARIGLYQTGVFINLLLFRKGLTNSDYMAISKAGYLYEWMSHFLIRIKI